MATEVEKLVIAIESVGLKESQRELTRLKRAAKNAEGATEGLGNTTKKLPPVFKGFRGATSALTNTTGQLSVQIQDVAVQLESGTDAVRVFAQQGPQIAAIFGPSGAAFGAILAVGALIGGPFIRQIFAANDAISESQKKLKEFSGDLSDLSDAAKRSQIVNLTNEFIQTQKTLTSLKAEFEDAKQRLEDLTDGSTGLLEATKEIVKGNVSLEEAQKDAGEAVTRTALAVENEQKKAQKLQTQLEVLTGKRAEETKEVLEKRENLVALVNAIDDEFNAIGKTAIELKVLEAARNNAGKSLQEQIRRQLEAIEADEARVRSLEEQARALEQATDALARFIERQEEIANQKDMSITMQLLTQATNLATKAGKQLTEEEFNRIVVAGQRLQQIEDEKQLTKDLNELDKLAKREQIERERALAQEQSRNQSRIKAEEAGREAEAAETRKALREAENEARNLGLLDAEQSEAESLARRLELAKRFSNDFRLSEKQRLEVQKNAERQKNEFIVKNTSDALNALGQINSTAFKAAKAYNIGQAIMSTYTGAAEALKLPFPINLAAAGAVIATGLAQVQTIRSQTFSGRALGGQVRGGESYVVGERGPEVLTMGSSGRITPNDKISSAQQVVNKVANINFNISTVDARGFDSLLQSRRGQIVTIVNQAMNDRGTRGVI